jgi:hypothetical protein
MTRPRAVVAAVACEAARAGRPAKRGSPTTTRAHAGIRTPSISSGADPLR